MGCCPGGSRKKIAAGCGGVSQGLLGGSPSFGGGPHRRGSPGGFQGRVPVGFGGGSRGGGSRVRASSGPFRSLWTSSGPLPSLFLASEPLLGLASQPFLGLAFSGLLWASSQPFLGLWAFSRLLDLDVFPAFSWSLETFSGSFFGPGASSGLLSLFPAFSGPRDLFWAFSELLDLFPTFFWASGLFPAFSGSGGLFWLSGCVLGFLRSS